MKALLLYNGHNNHISLRIVHYTLGNHFGQTTRDYLQPLDKFLFGALKTDLRLPNLWPMDKIRNMGPDRLEKNKFSKLLVEVRIKSRIKH